MESDIWNGYFKFCFLRNPCERAISDYYYQKQTNNIELSLKDYIRSEALLALKAKSYNLISINGQIAVNKIYRYEDLNTELLSLTKDLNLPEKLALSQTKTKFRKDKRPYFEILDKEDRNIIRKIFHEEMALMNYQC